VRGGVSKQKAPSTLGVSDSYGSRMDIRRGRVDYLAAARRLADWLAAGRPGVAWEGGQVGTELGQLP
jgi:hypothetical protein